MIPAPQPDDEFQRLQALYSLDVLDTPPDIKLDSITSFLSKQLDTALCAVSLVDVNRQWFKSVHGMNIRELERITSFCGHAIYEINDPDPQNRIFSVADTHEDKRFYDNPLVIRAPRVRSYIAYVLRSECGRNIGTLWSADTTKPRKYTQDDKQILALLGCMVENILYDRHHLTNIENMFNTASMDAVEYSSISH